MIEIDAIMKLFQEAERLGFVIFETFSEENVCSQKIYTCALSASDYKSIGMGKSKKGAKREASIKLYEFLKDLRTPKHCHMNISEFKNNFCRLLSYLASQRHEPSPVYKVKKNVNEFISTVLYSGVTAEGYSPKRELSRSLAAENLLKKIGILNDP
ncbi:hypothetical protein HZS_311 [Henneguya salminicola]|nr:hypothetical protein HZS_311 [Henneguya salminicola]